MCIVSSAAVVHVSVCASFYLLLSLKQPVEEKQQAKSTGVFQDEELLFSQSQQKDNDPDVDLFSTPGKAAVSINSNICICPFLVYMIIFYFSTAL